ncbi:MAG TPA: type 1 glutamine amidotransferase [Cellulomonas sp.]
MTSSLDGAGLPVLVLTHAPHEGPGLIGRLLGVPYRIRTVLDDPAPRLPAADELAGLVVMGGSMDADDVRGHPGLAAETRLIGDAVAAGLPVLGVCLGMQLLALALGAPLRRRAGQEIGFGSVDLVADDPLLSALGPVGSSPTVLHWHSDVVEPPPGATVLASTDTTPVQAFRAGSALGIQFHVELDANQLDLWLTTQDMVGGLSDDEVHQIRRDGAAMLPGVCAAGAELARRFGTQVISPAQVPRSATVDPPTRTDPSLRLDPAPR